MQLGQLVRFTYICNSGAKRKYKGRLVELGETQQKSTRTGRKREGFIDIETKWSCLVCTKCKAVSVKRRNKPRVCPVGSADDEHGYDEDGFEKGTAYVIRSFNTCLMSGVKIL